MISVFRIVNVAFMEANLIKQRSPFVQSCLTLCATSHQDGGHGDEHDGTLERSI